MEEILDKELIEKATNLFGIDFHKELLIEECAELILALQKLKRKRGKSLEEKTKDLYSELADVYIMIHAIIYSLNEDEVKKQISFKLDRLKEERLKEQIM